MPVSEWVAVPRQVPGTRPRARRVHGAPDGGRDARSGDPGLSRLRDRAVPEDPVRASASRIPPLRACSPSWCTCWWTRSTSVTWWRSWPTCSSPSRVDARDRAQPARLRRRPGVVLHGDARLRPVPRAVAVVQALLGGVGAAARGGGEAALGARQGERPRRAAPAGAPSLHASHGLGCRRGGGAHPHAGRLHLLQHQRAERVPHRLRHRGAARRVRAALRAVREYPAAAADGDQPASRDLSRAAGGGDPRLLPPGEPQRACRSTRSTWPPRRWRRDRSGDLRPNGRARGRRRGLGHRIYALERPLQPGDSLRLDFEVHVEPRGFRNRGVDPSVVANGSYFTNGRGSPPSAISDSRELIERRRPAGARARAAPA